MPKITKFEPSYLPCTTDKVLKPIIPVKLLSERNGGCLIGFDQIPSVSSWDNIVLICKRQESNWLDTFMCWNDEDEEDIFVYLGHWNDGVVES